MFLLFKEDKIWEIRLGLVILGKVLFNVYNITLISPLWSRIFQGLLKWYFLLFCGYRCSRCNQMSPPHLPVPSLPLHFLKKKKAGLPWISTKHGITSYNKTRYIPSYQYWVRQPSKTKRVPRGGNSIRDIAILTIGSPARTIYTTLTYMQRTYGKTHTGSLLVALIFVRLY